MRVRHWLGRRRASGREEHHARLIRVWPVLRKVERVGALRDVIRKVPSGRNIDLARDCRTQREAAKRARGKQPSGACCLHHHDERLERLAVVEQHAGGTAAHDGHRKSPKVDRVVSEHAHVHLAADALSPQAQHSHVNASSKLPKRERLKRAVLVPAKEKGVRRRWAAAASRQEGRDRGGWRLRRGRDRHAFLTQGVVNKTYPYTHDLFQCSSFPFETSKPARHVARYLFLW
eukprot:417531-Prymnesium_polylepis.4